MAIPKAKILCRPVLAALVLTSVAVAAEVEKTRAAEPAATGKPAPAATAETAQPLPPPPDRFIELPGGASVNAARRTVALPVEVVNLSGGLEFLLTLGKTKDYEAVLSTTVAGTLLHFALRSAGMEAAEVSPDANFEEKLKAQLEKGTRVEIAVQFAGDDKPRPLQQLLLWSDKSPLEKAEWYFAGSYFKNEEGANVYAADRSLCLIASYPTPEMVIGPTFAVDNPYKDGSKRYLIPNTQALPPVGTQGRLFIQAKAVAAP